MARRPRPRRPELGRRQPARAAPTLSPASASLASHTSRVHAISSVSRPPACSQQRVALPQHRSRSTPQLDRYERGARHEHVVEEPPPLRRPSLHQTRSSGENTVTRSAPSRSRARPRRWRLTCTRCPPARARLGLDQQSRPSSCTPRPARPPRSAPSRTSASVGAPGSVAAWRGSRSPRAGSSCPGRCAHDRRAPGRELELGVVVVAEVGEPQAAGRSTADQGTRTGISR